MRTLIVDTYYPSFLADHYASAGGLERRSYDEQLASLIGRSFGTADAYSRAFRTLGHEAQEVVANCAPLQAAWARERGTHRLARALARAVPRPYGGRLAGAVLAAQIREFRPDILYVQDPWVVGGDALEAARGCGALVVLQLASLPPPERMLRRYDLIVSSIPPLAARFREMGIDSEYLPLAFDERAAELLRAEGVGVAPDDERPHPISFAGTIHPPGVHTGGTAVLERLADEVGLELWGPIADELRPDSPIRARHHGEAWGLDMYRVLGRSRITFNRHGDVAEGYANNMRLFEATGMGALLLTEAAPNLPELFEAGVEVVAYEGDDDLIEKARHYLEHDDERRAIAAAGQARTLRDHTYGERIGKLGGMLESRLARS